MIIYPDKIIQIVENETADVFLFVFREYMNIFTILCLLWNVQAE
jgi:hypothetical protein